MNIQAYWEAVLKQQPEKMRPFFHGNAQIRWHNTNELFTLEEFIRANCEYPGQWAGEVERTEVLGEMVITVTHVYSTDNPLSFHVTSFLQLKEEKILSLDEYWGDDGPAPQWRQDKKIGTVIRE